MKINKKKKDVVLSASQLEHLVNFSIRNLEFVEIMPSEKDNTFEVVVVCDSVIEEITECFTKENPPKTDDEIFQLMDGHMVDQLYPFAKAVMHGTANEHNISGKEELWGFVLGVDKNNIANFVTALDDIDCMWTALDEEDEVINTASQESTLVEGNDTVQ